MPRKFIFPFGIIVMLGTLYLLTLAPGLSWANGGADGGDLITAVAVNGIPHPTGYPLYLLTAKIFQWLPISNLAFRTNLFSAFCTILAAILIYFTILHIQKEKKYGGLSAAIAALMFGLSPLVWSQAVITEVYGLQSLLTAGIIYLTIQIGDKPCEDIIRGLLFGLALGNHATGIFFFPLLLIDKETLRVSKGTHLLKRFLGLLAGGAVYLVLPLRALHQPVINWFNPTTLKSFYQLISGQLYQSYFSTAYIIDRARAWAGLMIENFSFPGVMVGIYTLLEGGNNKRFIRITAWIFLSYGVFALFYASYDSYVYLVQTIIAFSLWIGLSIDTIISSTIGKLHNFDWVLIPLLLFLMIFRINYVMPKVDASKDVRAESFGQMYINSVPENALIFAKDDQITFSLWYFHYANKDRLDTKVISESLLEFDWYRQTLRTTYSSLLIPETPDLTPSLLISLNSKYPYCFFEFADMEEINCFRYKN